VKSSEQPLYAPLRDTIAHVHTRADFDLAALKLCAMGERLGLTVTVVIKPQTKPLPKVNA
jgi:hypothetical protein